MSNENSDARRRLGLRLSFFKDMYGLVDDTGGEIFTGTYEEVCAFTKGAEYVLDRPARQLLRSGIIGGVS